MIESERHLTQALGDRYRLERELGRGRAFTKVTIQRNIYRVMLP